MGCIHARNSNRSRISIRVKELKYYIYIFNHPSFGWHVRGLEAIRHFRRLRVRGDPSFAAFEGWRRSVICGHRGGTLAVTSHTKITTHHPILLKSMQHPDTRNEQYLITTSKQIKTPHLHTPNET